MNEHAHSNASRSRALEANRTTLKSGIVGTGYIADFHARAIQATSEVDLVCVADANLRSAEAFAQRWSVPFAYDSLSSMLQTQRIDCVHLLVPPDHHFRLAKSALEAGVHVFLEKPMCTTVAEADELVRLATEKKLYLGVSHNFLFSDAYRQLRDTVRSGALGPISHVTIHHLFEMPQIRLGPFDSWMLREPGNLMLETGPHLYSAVLDLLGQPACPSVIADREVELPGGGRAFRRWRIRSNVGAAELSIDINFGPGFAQRKIFVRGLFGSATLDFDANICTVDRGTPSDPDIDRYLRTNRLAGQLRSQARRTMLDYVTGKLKLSRRGNPFQNSIQDAIAAFYSAIRRSAPLDQRIDGKRGRDVIEQCANTIEAAAIVPKPRAVPTTTRLATVTPTVLVLGGSGFIGQELIQQLLSSGYGVRAMIRGSSAVLEELRSERLDIVRGDIRNEADLRSAMADIEFVYHLAHAPAKTWQEYLDYDVKPTRLIAAICLEAKVKRLIYTGTIASYYAGSGAGTITEATPLDPHISRRDYYSRAKAASEDLLMEMYRSSRLPLVIFRPGIVIGKGGNPFHWGVGRFNQNVCEVWGDGHHKLPFVLASDVAAALVRGIQVPGIEGRSFNLIDYPLVSAQEYLDALQKGSGINLSVIHRPIWQFYVSDLAKWVIKMATGHPDRIRIPSYRDWETRTQKAIFDCTRARSELGWQPASTRERILKEGVHDVLDGWLAAVR
ncbi:Gfo/Idh/MocA family oxidoreductase [Bradyrhizobium sp. CB3481]|uniref:Gfo/Idh/MocA family oxidoreductase n=1 Tax=Bradyrhizobium sp. CB3481 TaxID=3039158 RepID=UPI0024B072C6|nr:Gfo/Idh/MocA family oxidoreductase [Bradyrhizobium sp. CB3481]WFU18789.1 Gfo/Idh/MocA family oxidoreductase [Bradyrhizobium sp. CB3481]